MENKDFYSDVEYNKAKRLKYFVFLILGILFIGGSGGSLVFFGGTSKYLGYIFLAILIFLICLTPSVMKNYPVKRTPVFTVTQKTVIIGKDEYNISRIEKVSVNITVSPVAKTDKEISDELDNLRSVRPDEKDLYRGTVDFTVKDKNGKITTVYTTVIDVIGALQTLTNRGLKKYQLDYTMKKLTRPATFKIEKQLEDGELLKDISVTERKKQLI